MNVYDSNMDKILVLILLLPSTAAAKDFHTMWALATSIKGRTQFPQFSCTLMLDDVRVLYYNGDTDTFCGRGNTTNEDSLFDPDELKSINDYIQLKWGILKRVNESEGVNTFQRLVSCEMKDNGESGQLITSDALQGNTIDKMRWHNGTLEYTSQLLVVDHDMAKRHFKYFYYPLCIKLLKGYLEKRRNQVNRQVQPTVRFFQKPGGSQACCLATGFYPHDINLTLWRDEQPVSEDDVTTGDLLPNDDGTYQIRKILEISAEEQGEKHKYTCSAIHLSLDNKLDVDLESETQLKAVVILVPTILSLTLIFVAVAAVILWKKQHAAPVITFRRRSAVSTEHMVKV